MQESYFFSSSFYYFILNSCTLEKNDKIKVPFRSGIKENKIVLQYNPNFSVLLSEEKFCFHLQNELLRIMLGHITKRKPNPWNPILAVTASDLAIGALQADEFFYYFGIKLQPGLCYEEYYNILFSKKEKIPDLKIKLLENNIHNFPPNASGESNLEYKEGIKQNSQGKEEINKQDEDEFEHLSALWNETTNPSIKQNLNRLKIKTIQINQNHPGKIPLNIIKAIQPELIASDDLQRAIKKFKNKAITSEFKYTPQRENRRYGWDSPGRVPLRGVSKILIFVDVSGSISDVSLQKIISKIYDLLCVNKMQIYVSLFDAELKFQPILLKRNDISKLKIEGRGGTNYEPIRNFLQNNRNFKNAVIITDGEASPIKPVWGTNILWVLENKKQYLSSQNNWMKIFGLVTFME